MKSKSSLVVTIIVLLFICCACGNNSSNESVVTGNEATESPSPTETSSNSDNEIDDNDSDSEDDSEELNYRQKLMKYVEEEYPEDDDTTIECINGLKELYPSVKNESIESGATSSDVSLFATYCAYLMKWFDVETAAFYVGEAGMSVAEAFDSGNKDDLKRELKRFKEGYSEYFAPLYDKQYDEGQYKVGKDIQAGEYVLFTSVGYSSGYFCVSSDPNGDDITFNDNFDYNSIITIKKGEYIELSRCSAVPMKDVKKIPKKKGTMFKVGKHIKAGTYKIKSKGGSDGYYCIYPDSRHDDIESNDNFKGTRYIKVKNGQYLLFSRATFK